MVSVWRVEKETINQSQLKYYLKQILRMDKQTDSHSCDFWICSTQYAQPHQKCMKCNILPVRWGCVYFVECCIFRLNFDALSMQKLLTSVCNWKLWLKICNAFQWIAFSSVHNGLSRFFSAYKIDLNFSFELAMQSELSVLFFHLCQGATVYVCGIDFGIIGPCSSSESVTKCFWIDCIRKVNILNWYRHVVRWYGMLLFRFEWHKTELE